MQKREISFSIKEAFILNISILLFFQIYLQQQIKILQYLDECISVLFFLFVFFRYKIRISIADVKIVILMVSLVLIGLVSGIKSQVQLNSVPVLTDIGNTLKVFMVFIGSNVFMKSLNRKDRIIKALASIIRILIAIMFCFDLVNFVFDIGMSDDIRFGIKSFCFINENAGQLSMMFYSIIMILTLDLQYDREKKHNKLIYIILALFVWCTTLRARAFMFVAIYIFLYRLIIIKRKPLKLNLKSVLVIFLFALLFGMDQMNTYFGNTRTARLNLLITGIEIMKKYFPLGSGFATFGTDAAAKYYSPMYYEYGLNNVYGLYPDNPMFAHDTYWPAIWAQFGVIGTIIVILILSLIVRKILRKSRHNRYCFLSGLFVCITLLLSSVATATFFHFVTVGVVFIIPLMFDNEYELME